ncbi:MAG: 50S ribosomal protein L1 [Neisseriales bacterium]|nr:MAG: 50S ribosomal protein L1 [Neisseriales bacterium]
MGKLSKRLQQLDALAKRDTQYSIGEALQLAKQSATAKFDESIDVAVNLGVDPRKSDQAVRGAVVLPHGTGKTLRIAVFAQGEEAEIAKEAGADIVGFEDLAQAVRSGNIDFDVVIATPSAMRVVGQLGQILGPRGMMPNPKVGTVSANVAEAVKKAKAGQVQYRTDKGGVVHSTIGRASFEVKALQDNLSVLVDALIRAKPSTAKGLYLKKITLSSTMGVGIKVDTGSVSVLS